MSWILTVHQAWGNALCVGVVSIFFVVGVVHIVKLWMSLLSSSSIFAHDFFCGFHGFQLLSRIDIFVWGCF